MVVIGDSITKLTATDLRERFPGAGIESIIRANNGFTAEQMLGSARAVAHEPAGQLIVNLGTNDVFSQLPTEETLSSLRQYLELFPDAVCVHFVTINTRMVSNDDPGLADRATRVNAGIRSWARDNERVSVIDWNRIVERYTDAGQPDGPLLLKDTVHPSQLGRRRLAEAYLKALESCHRG